MFQFPLANNRATIQPQYYDCNHIECIMHQLLLIYTGSYTDYFLIQVCQTRGSAERFAPIKKIQFIKVNIPGL